MILITNKQQTPLYLPFERKNQKDIELLPNVVKI